MAWQGIVGHDRIVEQFRRALVRGRLATSFLFVGPSGIGKRRFALALAQALLCPCRPEAALDPCQQCPACMQVRGGSHPDLDVVAKPPDKSVLPLDLLIGDIEHRMREGLLHRLGLKPLLGRRKVAIIDDADYLAPDGANALLKTLEEPAPHSLLILLATSPARQLPTIRSRCQLVRFLPLPASAVREILLSQQLVADADLAARLAAHSGGSVQRALELADDPLWQFRDRLLDALASPSFDGMRLASEVSAFVEAAGSEATPRRVRLRLVLDFATQFFRRLVRELVGASMPPDETHDRLAKALRHWAGNQAGAQACLQRCLDALEHVERYVNQSTLIESWAHDLARLRDNPHALVSGRL